MLFRSRQIIFPEHLAALGVRENDLPPNFHIIGSSLRWLLHDMMTCLFLLRYAGMLALLLFRGSTGT